LRGADAPRYNTEAMGTVIFLKDYLVWHYGRAVRDFFGVARDLLWFTYHFFSLPLLTRTLFSPFSRIHTRGFSILEVEVSLQNIALNFISRAVGFVLRVIVIAAGTASTIILASLLAIAFACWILLPVIIIFLFAIGVGILS